MEGRRLRVVTVITAIVIASWGLASAPAFAAPVTAPADGATTSTSLTLEADSPGGGLAFLVDGSQVGFDADSPYSFTVAGPLSEGDHLASVQECDTTGASCAGPASPEVSFTVKK